MSAELVDRHLKSGDQHLKHEERLSGTEFFCLAKTVDSVLAELGYPKIDFFSIDVEGAEMAVLRGIDFLRTRPRAFIIEVRNYDAIVALMAEKGYRIEEKVTHHDYLFVDGSR